MLTRRVRTLSLTREPLAELAGGDLVQVAGGYAATALTCALKDCLNRDLSDDISCYASCGHSGCCSMDWC